jgi:hypothetical protein
MYASAIVVRGLNQGVKLKLLLRDKIVDQAKAHAHAKNTQAVFMRVHIFVRMIAQVPPDRAERDTKNGCPPTKA